MPCVAVWLRVMLLPTVVLLDLALVIALGALGVLGAWLLRRRSTLSVKNLYLAAALTGLAFGVSLAARAWPAVLVLAPIAAPALAGALSGRRWRLADLGAGEELRQHELSRRWVWQPAPDRRPGERRYIASQGEIVHERPWPDDVEYVPMTAQGDRGARLPLGEGQHVFECGGTGTGKTTTARRLLAARTLAHGASALLIDQKGDPEDEEQLRRIAAAAGRPFVLFDPRDPETDRWQPLWGEPADVAARAVEPIKTSEPYYADVLRQHLNLIVEVLNAADRWPPSFPLLVDAARANRYETICDLAAGLGNEHRLLKRRVEEHAEWVSSRDGKKDLAGGLVRLELVMGAAWRHVLTPRLTPDGDTVAVSTRRGDHSRRRGDVAHLRGRHARRGRRDHGARALRPARRGRAGRRAVDADARRVRRGDPHGRRPRGRDPAARPLTPRAGDRDHPIRRRHRSALTTTRATALAVRQLCGVRRAPPDRARDPRLAREADGHPRDLAINRPNTRTHRDADRLRQPPAGQRVPNRLRRLRDASPRRSGHLHHARPRPTSARRSCPPAYQPTRPTGSGTATGTQPRSPCTPKKRSRSPCTTPNHPPPARPTSTRTTSSQVSRRSPRHRSGADGGVGRRKRGP